MACFMNNYPHTISPINYSVPNREYVLQHTSRGYRCISWNPHYIMTNWVKKESIALEDGDRAIEKFYKEYPFFGK